MSALPATTPAEEIRRLLDELHGEVVTREQVATYRRVRRASDRTVAILDWHTHTTRAPGLLDQLGVTATRQTTVPVQLRRWQADPCRCKSDLCWHGRWVPAGTATRAASVIHAGNAVPGGSPGWDADGALVPLTGGGKPDAEEPITDAWHAAEHIRDELQALGRELHEEGWRPPATLITIALEDEAAGQRIAARLRHLVQRARIDTGYDAAVATIRGTYCPECGGELRVRGDASSDVWCVGSWRVEGPVSEEERWPMLVRCGARWPRYDWVRLLAELEDDEQAS